MLFHRDSIIMSIAAIERTLTLAMKFILMVNILLLTKLIFLDITIFAPELKFRHRLPHDPIDLLKLVFLITHRTRLCTVFGTTLTEELLAPVALMSSDLDVPQTYGTLDLVEDVRVRRYYVF